MTTATTARPLLVPTGDPKPVERAVVDGIIGDFEPESFLWIVFRRPDGGAHVWYAWTDGGVPLGEQVDGLAMAAGMDAADWFHIANRHMETTTRGRVEVQAHPLRPVLADVKAGLREPGDTRDKLRRMIQHAAEHYGWSSYTEAPRWMGFGPTLLNRK